MHAHANSKPIRKCHGCPLNLKKRCAVFASPQEQWSHGHKSCKGYMNEALYRHYLDEQKHEEPPKSQKQVRREKMRSLKTVEHQDGIANPGGARW